MISTNYDKWNLHDAELIDLKYLWSEFKLVMQLKALLFDKDKYVSCQIICLGVSNIHIPHQFPWSDSKYINSINIANDNDHKIFEVEMISGDHIQIVLENIELVYDNITNSKDALSDLYGIEMEKSSCNSHLSNKCYNLYNYKSINEYTIEDLRLIIGQQMGLEYLVPLAIEELENNIFCQGDLYPGDLLKIMASVNKETGDGDLSPLYQINMKQKIYFKKQAFA